MMGRIWFYLIFFFLFFFNDTATTEIYTLSLHDALPIWGAAELLVLGRTGGVRAAAPGAIAEPRRRAGPPRRNDPIRARVARLRRRVLAPRPCAVRRSGLELAVLCGDVHGRLGGGIRCRLRSRRPRHSRGRHRSHPRQPSRRGRGDRARGEFADRVHRRGLRPRRRCTHCARSLTKSRWLKDRVLEDLPRFLHGAYEDWARPLPARCEKCDATAERISAVGSGSIGGLELLIAPPGMQCLTRLSGILDAIPVGPGSRAARIRQDEPSRQSQRQHHDERRDHCSEPCGSRSHSTSWP